MIRLSADGSSPDQQVSQILLRVAEGDYAARSELLPVIYHELRRMASARMRNEAVDHTLQPTALVHEAYLRLMRQPDGSWENRKHFFVAAAEAMRRILIEHARTRDAAKRDGGGERVPLSDLPEEVVVDQAEILAIHEALDVMEQEWPDRAALVKLRYFAGLDEATAATVLGISRATAARWWVLTKAWLFDRLSKSSPDFSK